MDEDGKNWSEGVGIPPVGLLACVLLNFMLANFDREFLSAFPGIPYSRYIDEGFVSFPLMSLQVENASFKDDLLSSLFELDLDGEIHSIVPGGPTEPCYVGLIFITRDGLIQVVEREEFS